MYRHLMQIPQPPKQRLPKKLTRFDMTFKSVFFLCILGHCLESGAGQEWPSSSETSGGRLWQVQCIRPGLAVLSRSSCCCLQRKHSHRRKWTRGGCGHGQKHTWQVILQSDLWPVFLQPGGGGRTPHMKGMGMLAVSLRGVNFGFWSLRVFWAKRHHI